MAPYPARDGHLQRHFPVRGRRREFRVRLDRARELWLGQPSHYSRMAPFICDLVGDLVELSSAQRRPGTSPTGLWSRDAVN